MNVKSEIDRASTKPDKLKVFIMSWNMGNAEQQGLNHVFEERKTLVDYDIIVLGLQESTYTIKGSTNPTECITQLGAQIDQIMGANYFKVQHCYRAQLQLYVFAKNSLKSQISHVQQSVENTGFLHVFPNKGGLLVSLTVAGTRLAFISCHLTAHEGVKHCEQRNCSTAEILGGVRTGDERLDVTHQFHHVFWMGDMNYRLTFSPDTPANTKKNIAELNAALKNAVVNSDDVQLNIDEANKDKVAGLGDDDSSDDEDESAAVTDQNMSKKALKKQEHQRNRQRVLDMIKCNQWTEMLAIDELNRELKDGRILNDFTALQPAFPPTFKRSRNMFLPEVLNKPTMDSIDEYYNAKRIPSYTDRILYHSMKAFNGDVTNLFFDSCERATSSDHKPVRAGFNVTMTKGREDIFVDRVLLSHRPSNVHSKAGPSVLRLQVDNLKGFNLEEMDSQMFGGGSDPYVILTTDPPSLLLKKGRIVSFHEGVKSSVIKHNLNPVWTDVLSLSLASVDLEGLSRNASLIVSVWDEDTYNADDLIGAFSLPFKEVLYSLMVENKPFEFDSVVKSNGEIMGRLTGRISIIGTTSDVFEDATIFSNTRAGKFSQQVEQRCMNLADAESEASRKNDGCCTLA